MKRIVVLIAALLLALGGVAWADSYEFEMVLSKDKNLCPAVMVELNRDLAQFKEVRYGAHKAFPVVKWKRMADLGSKIDEDNVRDKWRWAKLDFNNDTKVDLVVRHSSNDADGPNDVYFIFEGGYKGLKQVRSFQQFMGAFRKAGTGSVHTNAGYILRELPPSSPAVEYEWIERLYAITPFVVNGVTYLHIDQAEPATNTSENVLFHVVTKFTRPTVPPGKGEHSEEIDFGRNPKELQDVCYFKMSVDEFRVIKRSEDRLTLKP